MTAAEDILRQRMLATKTGQVTWACLDTDKTCADCAHYARDDGRCDGEGRCALVRTHTGMQGHPFQGSKARACSQFKQIERGTL